MRAKTKRTVASKPESIIPRTLMLSTTDGDYRISIPAGARVTFGPAVPYAPKNTYEHRQEGYSLRVYENSKNESLMAVFSGVKNFRDIAIPHAKLIVREAGKSVWKSDEEGYKVENEVKRSKKWADPLLQLETSDD